MNTPSPRLRAQLRTLRQPPITDINQIFGRRVQMPKNLTEPGRKRLYTPSDTFWLFLSQTLTKATSCRETVRKCLAWLAVEQGTMASPNAAAYCKARKRLLLNDIERMHGRIVRKAERTCADSRWYGRTVKVIDGSTLSMPDTPCNQQAYPQSTRQEPGCGFPIMRIVAVFSLHTGLMLAMAKGVLRASEDELFRNLWRSLTRGDVLLADRKLCSYAHFYFLALRGVDCVMRNNQRRTVGLTLIKRLGKGDRLIEWHKSRVYPTWPTKKLWDAIPDRMVVREITMRITEPGFRTKRIIIATTLTDPKIFPTHAFTDLYRKRWNAELYLCDIKVTMGMDMLRCKTPDMVDKKLWMHVIAYNLVRVLILEAATTHEVSFERISFKGTIDTVRQWAPLISQPHLTQQQRRYIYELLLYYLAKDLVPHRPNRREPQARKRRPKQYQSLTKPRRLFKEIPHRKKYRKA